MINFDLSTEKLRLAFGDRNYRKGYSAIKHFFSQNNFEHHQYSGYLSRAAMSYAEVYDLVLDSMVSKLPWLATCVQKFDATNVTSQSNMLNAIKQTASKQAADIPSLLEGDDEVVL